MEIKTITDAEDKEVGVFIPTELWQKLKQFVPVDHQLSSYRSMTDLVKDFSIFQLVEVSQSVLSSLKGFYARSIMKEEGKAMPAPEKIKDWNSQYEQLTSIQRDGSNFTTREKMEDLVLTYAPQLRHMV